MARSIRKRETRRSESLGRHFLEQVWEPFVRRGQHQLSIHEWEPGSHPRNFSRCDRTQAGLNRSKAFRPAVRGPGELGGWHRVASRFVQPSIYFRKPAGGTLAGIPGEILAGGSGFLAKASSPGRQGAHTEAVPPDHRGKTVR